MALRQPITGRNLPFVQSTPTDLTLKQQDLAGHNLVTLPPRNGRQKLDIGHHCFRCAYVHQNRTAYLLATITAASLCAFFKDHAG
eukprot:scaffold139758_cov17-Tisochrysis_lutea.AAC.1